MMPIERVGRGGWALWLLLLVFAFWGGEAKGRAGAHRHERAQAAGASQPLPSALRAAYLATRQAEGGAAYAVREGTGGLVADNPAQGLSIAFSEQGVALAGAGAPRATLTPVRFGCAGEMREVGPARPEMREGRVAFPRQGFVEWYVNGPLGLEQGFNVEEPPRCAGAQAEALEVELGLGDGLSASLEAGGEQIALRDAAGQRVLGLSELYAIDARGNVLPARLGVTGARGVSMRVETAGAVYPLVIDPLVWKEQKLLPSDVTDGELFGNSAAISGDTAIIGAPGDSAKGHAAGAAYVYVRQGASWTQQQKLLSSDGTTDDFFGVTVAISGDTALVTAGLSGVVYVFLRQGTSWIEQKKLLRSGSDTSFGDTIAISGDTALVSAQIQDKKKLTSSVYVFVRQGSSWSEQQKLLVSDGLSGAAARLFGGALALEGDTALVGSSSNDEKGEYAGAVYVFVRQGASWSQQAKLFASDAAPFAGLGYSIALSGDTALVGADGNAAKGENTGAAYVFVRQGASWSQQARFLASDAKAGDYFGASVALAGDTALVSAVSTVTQAGAVYAFLRQGASWSQQARIVSSAGSATEYFGSSVALAGDAAIVTAPERGEKVPDRGMAYALLLSEIPCSKDADCNAPPPEDCSEAVCNTATGACGTKPKLDGAVCPAGICTAGECGADPTSSSSAKSASSAEGAGGAGGAGAGGKDPGEVEVGGCGCATRGAPNPDALGEGAMLLLGLLPLARRGARRRA